MRFVFAAFAAVSYAQTEIQAPTENQTSVEISTEIEASINALQNLIAVPPPDTQNQPQQVLFTLIRTDEGKRPKPWKREGKDDDQAFGRSKKHGKHKKDNDDDDDDDDDKRWDHKKGFGKLGKPFKSKDKGPKGKADPLEGKDGPKERRGHARSWERENKEGKFPEPRDRKEQEEDNHSGPFLMSHSSRRSYHNDDGDDDDDSRSSPFFMSHSSRRSYHGKRNHDWSHWNRDDSSPRFGPPNPMGYSSKWRRDRPAFGSRSNQQMPNPLSAFQMLQQQQEQQQPPLILMSIPLPPVSEPSLNLGDMFQALLASSTAQADEAPSNVEIAFGEPVSAPSSEVSSQEAVSEEAMPAVRSVEIAAPIVPPSSDNKQVDSNQISYRSAP